MLFPLSIRGLRGSLRLGAAIALLGLALLRPALAEEGAEAAGAAPDPADVIDRGIAYLETHVGEEPNGLAFAHFLRRRFALDAFEDAPARYDGLLEAPPRSKNDPPKAHLRVYRRLLWPDNEMREEDVAALTLDFDRVTARALYCDRHPLPDDYADRLREAVARGGYDLTHAGLALMWLRDNGCPWPVDEDTVGTWLEALKALLAKSPPGDVEFEAAGVLQYLGYGLLVPRDFEERVLRAQNEDGGWGIDETQPESHWHPTLLATWYLLETRAPARNDVFVPQGDAPVPVATGAPGTPSAEGRGPEVLDEKTWRALVASEERLLALSPLVGELATSIENLHLPGERRRPLFADKVRVTDVGPAGEAKPWFEGLDATHRAFPIAPTALQMGDALRIWQPLFDLVEYFENASLKMVRGDFEEGRDDVYRAEVKVAALARLRDGDMGWIRGKVYAVWQKEDDPAPDSWRITEWKTKSLDLVEAPRLAFREVLGEVVVDDAVLREARRSEHDELVRKYLTDPSRKPEEHFFPPAMDRHPGLAVVDLDRDGVDDLYFMPHWGRNLFFRGLGDGRFEEIGAELGLDVDGETSSAVFADFDNDGDLDAFLGRTLEPSLYLRNDGGKFIDASSSVRGRLPRLVSSVTTVDVDADGLLDVYVSTYAARMLSEQIASKEGKKRPLLEPYLSPEEGSELREHVESASQIYDLAGPPNVLLRNLGDGTFAPDDDSALRVFANTYQATWADYDGDGDSDVYLANDFAPNHLLRNDGRGSFTDVTAETRTADVGFGMGATWGDYDLDGDQDLYVSNMFSKAGTRITARLEGLDARFPKMARGNTLFRNDETDFHDMVEEERDDLGFATQAGWSWGGQFADVDNDTYPDLFVLAGYYSAPPEHALPVDT